MPRSLWFIAGVACFGLALASCRVGPDFAPPAPPHASRYTPEALPKETVSAAVLAGEAQRFAMGRDIPAEWWTLFHSPALTALIAQAFKANPDLAAAEAALRQAHELTLAGQGAFYPVAQAGLSTSRNKTAATLSPATASGNLYYSLYTAQLAVSYVPDVFGGTRRAAKALAAQEEAQRFQLEAVALTLTSNLVASAVTEAALRGQIGATNEIIGIQRQVLDILRREQALGQAAGADVAAQEAVLAQAEAALPALQKQLAQQHDLLAVLAGRFPDDPTTPKFELASLQLPQELPVSLPSQLVEQRPDIRAAQAQLRAASAVVGVAIANRLPQIALSADPGLTATTLAQIFAPGAFFWSLGGSAAQTVFDAGTLRHKQGAAEAALGQAEAQYRATVQKAFQNVADALQALQADAAALRSAAAAEQAAAKSIDIAKRQLALGAISYLTMLNAQSIYAQARIGLVNAQAARYADTTALFQALGGGWSGKIKFHHAEAVASPVAANRIAPWPRATRAIRVDLL